MFKIYTGNGDDTWDRAYTNSVSIGSGQMLSCWTHTHTQCDHLLTNLFEILPRAMA